MKLLITLFFIFITSNAFAIIAAPYSNSVDNTGTVTFQDNVFIRVENGNATAIVNGDAVIWDYADLDGVSVTDGSTDGEYPACVVADASIAVGSTGLCQVYGRHSAVNYENASANRFFTSVGASTGDQLFISSTAGSVEKILNIDQAAWQVPVCIALDASTATGDLDCYINLM